MSSFEILYGAHTVWYKFKHLRWFCSPKWGIKWIITSMQTAKPSIFIRTFYEDTCRRFSNEQYRLIIGLCHPLCDHTLILSLCINPPDWSPLPTLYSCMSSRTVFCQVFRYQLLLRFPSGLQYKAYIDRISPSIVFIYRFYPDKDDSNFIPRVLHRFSRTIQQP